jgi:uncharacterized protein (DUF1330 family)
MPAGYVIALVDVNDMARYKKYVEKAPIASRKFGVKMLAQGGRTKALEGGDGPSRVVVMQFPSYEDAEAFYNSPEYQDARNERLGAADFRLILVEGV